MSYTFRNRFLIFIAILFYLLPLFTKAQNNNFYNFHTFSLKDGLTQSTVYAILRDNNGYLWIGTGAGLSRFDGQLTTRYFASINDSETIPGNRIFSIIDDTMGNVWIATSGGLVRFDDNKNIFERQEINGKPIIGNTLSVLPDGIFCTSVDSFYKYDYKTKKWQTLPVKSKNKVDLFFTSTVMLSNNKFLLSARHKNLYLYDINTGEFCEAAFYEGKHDVNKVYLDNQNLIWVAPYGEGLMCYSQTGQLIKIYNTANSGLNNNVVLDIIEHNGSLWIGTDGGGINILNTANDEFSHLLPIPEKTSSFPARAIASLYKDKWNNLWVGSIRNGLIEVKSVFMTTYLQTTFGNPHGLSSSTVISLLQEDDSTIWIGTDGGGINKFNPKNRSFEHFQASIGDKVSSIVKHTKDELLISVFGQGVYYFNKKTGRKRRLIVMNEKEDFRVLRSGYTATLQTNDGIHYLILSDSIYEYDSRNNSFTIIHLEKNISEQSHVIRQVISDTNCRFLFTANTLYSRTENKEWKKMISFPSEEIIGTVALGYGETLWIGTNYGLNRFNPHTDSVAHTIPLPYESSITSLICDYQNRLWIGTNGTLWVYYVNENRFEQFDVSSGAIPNEYMPRSVMISGSGNIYMGGVNGLLFIDKNIIPSKTTQPEIQLNEVICNDNLRQKLYTAGKNIGEPPRLKLAWNKSSITMQIMVPEKDIFRKRLFHYYISGFSGKPI